MAVCGARVSLSVRARGLGLGSGLAKKATLQTRSAADPVPNIILTPPNRWLIERTGLACDISVCWLIIFIGSGLLEVGVRAPAHGRWGPTCRLAGNVQESCLSPQRFTVQGPGQVLGRHAGQARLVLGCVAGLWIAAAGAGVGRGPSRGSGFGDGGAGCVSRGAGEGARARIRVWRGELGQRARGMVATQVRVIAQEECDAG